MLDGGDTMQIANLDKTALEAVKAAEIEISAQTNQKIALVAYEDSAQQQPQKKQIPNHDKQ